MLNKYNQIRISIMVGILTGVLMSIATAHQTDPLKHAAEPIDPTLLDLTQPTLFIVPYSHLDDFWRWSYPQTIRDYYEKHFG